MMRVIAGSARRLQLKTLDSLDTRPTQDRIKETLFNMIQMEVPGCDFLDLFAGSGGIGIEALSRGARRAVFADNSKNAVSIIQDNIAHCGFGEQSLVMCADYMSALNRLQGMGYHFGIVYLDPPYGRGLEKKALRLMAEMDYIDPETIFIIEAELKEDFSEVEDQYEILREKNYKSNKHIFLRRRA